MLQENHTVAPEITNTIAQKAVLVKDWLMSVVSASMEVEQSCMTLPALSVFNVVKAHLRKFLREEEGNV